MKLNLVQTVLSIAGLMLLAFATSTSVAQVSNKPAKQPNQQVLIDAEHIELGGKQAFIEEPAIAGGQTKDKPWVFYAATRPNFPDKAELEMHRQLLDAGIAIAGIDVGEAYGSPKAFSHFESLYKEMSKRGYSAKPVLLGRSRGGLWVSSWAIKHPEKVKAIACIYPAFDFTTYPGSKRAAPAYELGEQELLQQQDKLNPIRRCNVLARHRIPVFIIHGEDDDVVPIRQNSDKLVEIYAEQNAAKFIKLLRIKGQGHNYWPGFFQCKELIKFVIAQSNEKSQPAGTGTGVVTTWRDDATAAVSLTIDDNNRPDHDWWLALGEKYKVHFTWFVITDRIETNATQFGTWDDFKRLQAAGHDIQSHTVDHLPNFPESGPLKLEENYRQAIKDIEAKIPNAKVLTLAYPMGLTPPNDSALAAKHYIAARGVKGLLNEIDSIDFFNVNSLSTDSYRKGFPIPGVVEPKHWAYIPKLVTPGNPHYRGWLSVHSHGVKADAKEAVTKLLDYVNSKPGDYWIAPFTSVAQYAQQRAASKLTVSNDSDDRIQFTLVDTLDDTKFHQPLTVKIEVGNGWSNAIATQQGNEIPVTLVNQGGARFLLVNSVPDQGTVVVKRVALPAGNSKAPKSSSSTTSPKTEKPADSEQTNEKPKGQTFYVDPINGKAVGDGSAARPWRTLEEVFSSNLIQSRETASRSGFNGTLKVKNPGAPIKPGDTIRLLDGFHGNVLARGYHNDRMISIEAEPGATPQLRGFKLQGGSNWKLKGISLSPEHAKVDSKQTIVHCESHSFHGPVQNVVIDGLTIFTATDTRAWTKADWNDKAATGIDVSGSNITIRDNNIRNVHFGIKTLGDDILASGNVIENYSGDGMRGGGDRVTFDSNKISWSYNVDENHDDAIQFYRKNGVANRDVVLKNNLIRSYPDAARPLTHGGQGIGNFDGPYVNWKVENNVVMVANHHGISFYGAKNVSVINNTVLDITGSVKSWILFNTSSDCLVRNNLASSFSVVDSKEIRSDHNLELIRRELNSIFVDWKNGDLHLKPASAAVGAGTGDTAPSTDIHGTARPPKNACDLGAFNSNTQ